MSRALIIDDDQTICHSLKNVLEEEGYESHFVQTGEEALEILKEEKHSLPDAIFLDIQLPDINGMELLSQIRTLIPEAKVIMMTGFGDISQAVEAMKRGASDFLLKPFHVEDVLMRLKKALEEQLQVEKLRYYEQKVIGNGDNDCVVGDNSLMKKIYASIDKIAASSSSTVLIQGETGTGKELIAKRIHQLSPRHKEPYVVVNAAALSGDLLESELFGHEAGAFTGAMKRKKGLFEVANKGTLVLDEIGEMEGNLQAKLLRALQDKIIRRVGGVENIPVDVRLIASTNANLENLVKEKLFRQDLYFRLNVVNIILPPLRDRLDDLKVLADSFIMHFNQEFKQHVKGVHPEAIKQMKSYRWPGNIRELRNFIERIMLLENVGDEINKEHIGFLDPSHTMREDLVGSGREAPGEGLLKIGQPISLEALEQEHIAHVLKLTGGNKNQTAQILGIDRTTLYNKIKKYKIVLSD